MKKKPVNILFVLSIFGVVLLLGIYGGMKFELLNLTGFALNNLTHLNITIQSTAPIIYFVSPLVSQSVTESSFTDISFVAYVLEVDGIGTVRNSSSMNASAKFPGATTRTNLTCERIANINTTAANYSCTVRLWYWDAAGVWTVNVSVNDTSNSISNVNATTFTLGVTTAIVMAPNTLAWASIASTATNQTPTDYLRINNTANKNLTKMNVTAINLQGISDTSKILNASDFSVNYTTDALTPRWECGGYVLENQTAATDATEITGMKINPNNNTAGFGNSTVYVCLLRVTAGVTPQDYSTSNVGRWTVTAGG